LIADDDGDCNSVSIDYQVVDNTFNPNPNPNAFNYIVIYSYVHFYI